MISSAACAGADAVRGSAASRVRAMRCLVDAARRDGGRRPLKLDRRLTRSAVAKTRGIARCARFDHDPCAHGWAVGIRRARYRRVGENLAFAQSATPRQVITEWLASPEHRKNLLSLDFRATGLARGWPFCRLSERWSCGFSSSAADAPDDRPAARGKRSAHDQ